MQTQLLTDHRQAAEIIRHGGLVAFPTETVFGLGADATNSEAVAKLFLAKGRPGDNPLIVHLHDRSQLPAVAREVPSIALRLLDAFAPGPLTIVVPKHKSIVRSVTAGLDTVGVRIPDHELARAFLKAADLPIAAPSANRSGKPSGTTVEAVLEDLGGWIDAILIGGTSRIGLESTVVDCSCLPPRVLRPGAVTLEQLRSIVPDVEILNSAATTADNSPGLRHAHYRPAAEVRLVERASQVGLDSLSAYMGIEPIAAHRSLGLYRCFDSVDKYASELYETLRHADRLGIKTIYCQTVPAVGVGQALADRLRRAASTDFA